MKIGINATFLNEKPTGVCVFTVEISRSLVKLHNNMVIFSPFDDSRIPVRCLYKVPKGVRGSTRLMNNLFRILYLNAALPVLCKRNNVDVLYCPITEFPFSPVIPMVVHIHDLHPIHFPLQFGLAAKRFRFSLQHIHKIAKRITVPSQHIKNELLSYTNVSGDSIDVIPNGYDRLVFKPQKPEGKSAFLNKYAINREYILFVGNLYPYKNVRTLIEAFLRIKHRILHDLVVVGQKSFAGEDLLHDARIHYKDYVPAEDLPLFYSYADVFVYPSIAEGFGLAPLEAMACGVPVISSRGGSLPEVVNGAGILFAPGDSASLSKWILEVVADRTLRSDLVEKGFRNVERFSWEKAAEGILRSCERVFSGK
jgi:glycosyltransferase involved in cell wall biosynthesis